MTTASTATWLGIDLGTTSVKALLLDQAGHVVASAARTYALASPRPGWAEIDPNAWWMAATSAVRACLDGRNASQVGAIGLSGNMHGVVLCAGDGTPTRPAVLWADTRSVAELATYAELPARLKRRLANPAATGFAGPTLLWLKRHEAGAYQQARWALQPKDWLRLRLTGQANSEPSDASATLLYDLQADEWSDAAVEELGLRRSLLAPLVPSSSVAGLLTHPSADALGLAAGLPVAAGGGDTACAALGSALTSAGKVQVTVGSGLQVVAIVPAAVPDGTLRTHLYRTVTDGWYAMAAVQNAGLALEWVRGVLGVGWDAFYADAFARPAGAEGLTFLPYLTGERTPHMDPSARGAWFGLSLHHGRADLARAAFEGVAFAFVDALRALEDRGVAANGLRLAGGGSLRAEWRQLLSDASGQALFSTDVSNVSALGAARLAARAAGSPTTEPEPDLVRVATPHPDPALRDAYRRYRDAYRRR